MNTLCCISPQIGQTGWVLELTNLKTEKHKTT